MSILSLLAAAVAGFTLAAAPVETPLEELPAQRLAAGQCGLFLWSRTSPPRRVLMASQSPAIARIQVGGATLELPRVAWEGEAVYGHYAMQRYAGSGHELTVRIETDVRTGLTAGAVAPVATIEHRAPGGWDVVIPAAGLIGCQP